MIFVIRKSNDATIADPAERKRALIMRVRTFPGQLSRVRKEGLVTMNNHSIKE